jgi:membrane associated rhomboid family serine protease
MGKQMPRSGPTTLALPPFSGATRRLVLIGLSVFFAVAVLGWVLPAQQFLSLIHYLNLVPAEVFGGRVWELLTYSFMPLDILGTLLTLLFLWFVGAMLEDARGSRWLYEIFFTSAIGGGLLASALSYTHVLDLSQYVSGFGPGAPLYGLLIAVLVLMGDREFLLFFLIRIQAKYLVIIYILIDIARLLLHQAPFFAALDLSGALCGWLYLRFAPRRGMGFGFSEQFYGVRNAYYRAKRRHAAKKFEVYMGKQGRTVNFDKEGRYIDPDGEKDPKDKKWMN